MATRGGLSQWLAYQGGESLARCRRKQAETLLEPRRVEREEEPRSVPTYRTQADPRAARNEHGGSSGCPLGSIVERDVDLAAMDEHEFVLGQMVVHSHRSASVKAITARQLQALVRRPAHLLRPRDSNSVRPPRQRRRREAERRWHRCTRPDHQPECEEGRP